MGKKIKINESGQALTEYIILLSMVIVGLGYFINVLTHTFDLGTLKLGGKMEVQLRTGKAPASAWNK